MVHILSNRKLLIGKKSSHTFQNERKPSLCWPRTRSRIIFPYLYAYDSTLPSHISSMYFKQIKIKNWPFTETKNIVSSLQNRCSFIVPVPNQKKVCNYDGLYLLSATEVSGCLSFLQSQGATAPCVGVIAAFHIQYA